MSNFDLNSFLVKKFSGKSDASDYLDELVNSIEDGDEQEKEAGGEEVLDESVADASASEDEEADGEEDEDEEEEDAGDEEGEDEEDLGNDEETGKQASEEEKDVDSGELEKTLGVEGGADNDEEKKADGIEAVLGVAEKAEAKETGNSVLDAVKVAMAELVTGEEHEGNRELIDGIKEVIVKGASGAEVEDAEAEEFDAVKWASSLEADEKELLGDALVSIREVSGEEYGNMSDEEKVASALNLVSTAAFVDENLEEAIGVLKAEMGEDGVKQASDEDIESAAIEGLLKYASDQAEAEQALYEQGLVIAKGFLDGIESAE